MREVSKARVMCGIMSISLLFYDIFVNVPDLLGVVGTPYLDPIRLVLPLLLRIGFYASMILWSLSGVLRLDESVD